ncbi:hypothetical protein AB1Y20_014288 [Prymnesium parvum]|uniref:Nucleotide-diphospho-sugar transferase domain-containing protein n=1 Tax=Prymnesium parvum TaxID=97485 RepID=A0AB34IFT3_PRYPA
MSDPRCHTMAPRLALRPELAAAHASNGTLIATFTNPKAAPFALNWARCFHALHLKTLVGISQRLGPRLEAALHAAGAGLFCADGAQMQRNGQAGRWAELLPLLRMGYHVLLSDSDIGWLRDPLPFFAAARRAHPTLDLALLTDQVINTYSATPLHGGGGDLELEHALHVSYPSLNIGVIFFYSHALPRLAELVSLGVLPMLQFATSFTYFMFRRRAQELGARPYCIHAIFAHGKEPERKRMILRDAMAWHDPPEYYTEGRYLRVEMAVPTHTRLEGGFEMIQAQLQQFRAAMWLARAMNRTLILPRLRCDDRAMAYPCYAWYHRAVGYSGFNFFQKVAMPDYCPPYYWLGVHCRRALPCTHTTPTPSEARPRLTCAPDAVKLDRFDWPTREPSFLSNPRTPPVWADEAASLHLCAKAPCVPRAAGKGVRVHHPGRTRLSDLLAAAAPLEASRVVTVEHLYALSLRPSEAPPSRWGEAVEQLSTTMWCTPCPVTRRGAVVAELNRSSRRALEHFCRVEARAKLGWPGYKPRACCPPHVGACHECTKSERRPVKEAELSWHVKSWLPVWAHLRDPPEFAAVGPAWRCEHPLCTGSDRQRFP